jgi:hypothetical protein
MLAVRRMTSTLAGAQPIADPRRLSLRAIASETDAVQFAAAGGAPLYNRDVLAFFPFQLGAHRFVSAVYVMTRDLARFYTVSLTLSAAGRRWLRRHPRTRIRIVAAGASATASSVVAVTPAG